MKTLAIQKTVQPDHKFISYSAWCKYVKHQVDKFKTKTNGGPTNRR